MRGKVTQGLALLTADTVDGTGAIKMNKKTSRLLGYCIASILLPYLCAIYIPRAWGNPTRWNIFWALFWIEGFVSTAVDSGIRSANEFYD